jgi:hypothetical protein
MTGADPPVPVPGSPPDRLAEADRHGTAQPWGPLRRQLTSGTAAVAMICAPVAAVFIFRAIHAAEQHRRGSLAGLAWAALCFLGLPVLGVKLVTWCWGRWGHVLRARKPPEPPPSLT